MSQLPIPPRDQHELMRQLADDKYLRELMDGKPAFDKTGQPIMRTGSDGKLEQVMRPLNAAEMNVIERRLEKLGVGKRATTPTDRTKALQEEAERRIQNGTLRFAGKPVSPALPPLDTEGSDAASA